MHGDVCRCCTCLGQADAYPGGIAPYIYCSIIAPVLANKGDIAVYMYKCLHMWIHVSVYVCMHVCTCLCIYVLHQA